MARRAKATPRGGGQRQEPAGPVEVGRRTVRRAPAVRATAVTVGLAALAGSLVPAPASGAAGGWSATGQLAAARSSHAAVLLQGGKVLVVGGEGKHGVLASTEIYRPELRTWAPGPPLATARHSHTATRLADGRVLVVGGRSETGPLATAEVYDPVAKTWSSAGLLTTGPRYWHTATRLADGRVLVAGGLSGQNVPGAVQGENVALSTAELWSPSTGRFSAVGLLGEGRDSHTATLLRDGRVLVAGGITENSAELFDPATLTWSMTGSMSRWRWDFAAGLMPDGTVLVTGGCCPTPTAERYDPATGAWSVSPPMRVARMFHSATVLSSAACATTAPPAWCGRMMVVAGVPYPEEPTAVSEVWDPVAGAWTTTGSIQLTRWRHTATLMEKNGKVLVAGGEGGDGPVRVAEIFSPPLG